MLTLKQMLQRLPKTIAPIKASNASEDFLNEIREIISYLHRNESLKMCIII